MFRATFLNLKSHPYCDRIAKAIGWKVMGRIDLMTYELKDLDTPNQADFGLENGAKTRKHILLGCVSSKFKELAWPDRKTAFEVADLTCPLDIG